MAEQTNHVITTVSQLEVGNFIPEVQRWILFRLETQKMNGELFLLMDLSTMCCNTGSPRFFSPSQLCFSKPIHLRAKNPSLHNYLVIGQPCFTIVHCYV